MLFLAIFGDFGQISGRPSWAQKGQAATSNLRCWGIDFGTIFWSFWVIFGQVDPHIQAAIVHLVAVASAFFGHFFPAQSVYLSAVAKNLFFFGLFV